MSDAMKKTNRKVLVLPRKCSKCRWWRESEAKHSANFKEAVAPCMHTSAHTIHGPISPRASWECENFWPHNVSLPEPWTEVGDE